MLVLLLWSCPDLCFYFVATEKERTPVFLHVLVLKNSTMVHGLTIFLLLGLVYMKIMSQRSIAYLIAMLVKVTLWFNSYGEILMEDPSNNTCQVKFLLLRSGCDLQRLDLQVARGKEHKIGRFRSCPCVHYLKWHT